MNKFDDAVRDAVRDLSDQGRPPVDLGPRMVAAGRRMQYRRSAITAVASVAAVIAVAAPVLAVDTIRDNSVAATGSPSPTFDPNMGVIGTPPPTGLPNPPLQLPAALVTVEGASMVAARADGDHSSFVWDAAKKKYVTVPYFGVLPNPARTLALVRSRTWPGKVGLLDLRTNKVDWTLFDVGLDRSVSDNYAWSPDGSKAIVGGGLLAYQGPFVVLDVATRTVSPLIDIGKDYGWVTFHPNGRELVATKHSPPTVQTGTPLPTRSGNDPMTSGFVVKSGSSADSKPLWIQVFDLAGKPTRKIAVPALIVDSAQWAPDGRRLITWNHGKAGGMRVYDTVTGKSVAELPSLGWFPRGGHGIQWLDADRLLISDWDREKGKFLTNVVGLDGRPRKSQELPWYGDGYTPIFDAPTN